MGEKIKMLIFKLTIPLNIKQSGNQFEIVTLYKVYLK